MLKRHKHTPAHLFLDNKAYFITGAIHQKRFLLAAPELKQKLMELIKRYFDHYNWQLHHWVILDNHYHLMGKSREGKDLTAMIQSIHRASAPMIVTATGCEKPVWWNYWDYCPRDEYDYWTRINYLLYNPVKHGYVTDLNDYPFSSFQKSFSEMGRGNLAKQFQKYSGYRNLVLKEADDDF